MRDRMFAAIGLIRVASLRSLVDPRLILLPLALAGLFTAATGVLIGIPFNLANVIVRAVVYLLLCTTVLLPALMSWRDRRRA